MFTYYLYTEMGLWGKTSNEAYAEEWASMNDGWYTTKKS